MKWRSPAAFVFWIIAASMWVEPGRTSESATPVEARSSQLERIAFGGAALLARALSEHAPHGARESKCPAAKLGRICDLRSQPSANGGMMEWQIHAAALKQAGARQAIVGAAILAGLRPERGASCARGSPSTRALSLASAVEQQRFLEAKSGRFCTCAAPPELGVALGSGTRDPIGSRLNTVEASSASTGSERGDTASERTVRPNSFPSARVAVDPPENDLEAGSDGVETRCAAKGRPSAECGHEIGRSDTARFRLPVRASIARRFGEREGEQRLRGLVLSTDRAQPILAPGDGVVAYAGPFRGIGALLIIEHRDAYHSLVIGASRLEVRAGDVVTEGQAVGWLARGSSGNSDLYVELRRAGVPVDPMSFLSALEGEVRG